jgi:hypothetical protein
MIIYFLALSCNVPQHSASQLALNFIYFYLSLFCLLALSLSGTLSVSLPNEWRSEAGFPRLNAFDCIHSSLSLSFLSLYLVLALSLPEAASLSLPNESITAS